MSKLRLNGTSSGYVEIAAPATGANNTITLPSTTGSIVVQGTSGITSFTSGPVLIGSGTSTGTASQTLQVTGGVYVSGRLGVGSGSSITNPKSTLQVSDSSISAPIPTLGIATASLYVTNLDNNYGLLVGSISNGNSWMQVQRTDGVATAYDLLLQPSGGNVAIGTNSPAAKLQSAGTSGSAQFRAGTATNGYFEINAFDSNPVYCVIGGSNATAGVFGTQSNIPTIFFTNNTERARFTSDGSFSITQTPGKYTVDTTGGATSIANNGTVDFSNASGMLVVNNHSNGAVTIYLCGGGIPSAVSSVVAQVGTLTYVAGINGYRFTNTYGSAATFGFFFVRTRTNA